MRILLVDDNELNAEIAEYLLTDAGAQVAKARDGQEAVDVFAASAPFSFDAVLMDIMMPVMDGYEATRSIIALDRPDAKRVPIIAMTANAFADDRRLAREAGMVAHVSKPFDLNQLTKLLSRYRRGGAASSAAHEDRPEVGKNNRTEPA